MIAWPESEIEVTFTVDWKLKVTILFAGIFGVLFFVRRLATVRHVPKYGVG
jgi:hypothetical protein